VSIKYRGDVDIVKLSIRFSRICLQKNDKRVSDNTNLKIGFSRVGTKEEKGT
jgi:hypothetical protein